VRERGQLKRLRGTPMPAWTFIPAQVLRATAQALAMTALLLGVDAIACGVPIPASTFPAFSTSRSAPQRSACWGSR
jgi:ABC-2 type transport system permease protein